MARNGYTPNNTWLKPRVIAGFVLVVLFSAASIVIAFNNFSEFHRIHNELSKPNDNLLTINMMVTELFEAESDVRSFMLTADEQYLSAYNSKQQRVEQHQKTLREQFAHNAEQQRTLQQLSNLLANKRAVVDELLTFAALPNTDAITNSLNELRQASQMARPTYSVVQTTTITHECRDTTYTVLPNGFIARIRALFTGPHTVDSTLTSTATSTHYDSLFLGRNVPDTALRRIEQHLTQFRTQQNTYIKDKEDKELQLLDSDRQIMDQIRSLILQLEHQELTQSHIRNAEISDLIQRSTIWVVLLAAITLVFLLLLLALIFSDISRSNVHRAQLLEAKHYAEQLLRAKEQFLANMSHEIRNPLSAVVGLTRQLSKSNLPQKQQQQVDVLENSANHMLNIINDILDYSKLEAGQMRLEQHQFKPAELAQEVALAFESRAQEKGLALFARTDPSTPQTLWGDSFRLKQIAMNLVSNALKFTHQGSIIISLSPARSTESYTNLQLTVSDTGIGIAPELQNAVFEDFTQAEASVSRQYGGTGLGLSIVKKLVDIQGGEVILTSQPDCGTTVSVIIPYATHCAETADTHTTTTNYSLGTGLRVLIIDDDPVNRLIVEEMARSIGLEADGIGSPTEIATTMEQQAYAAIITDIQMPTMSGYDLMHMADEREWNIPVVAITANATVDSDHFVKHGFSGFLVKPFTETELQAVLGPLIGQPITQATTIAPRPKHQRRTQNPNTFNLDDIYRFTSGDRLAMRSILSAFLDNSYINLKAITDHVKRHEVQQASAVAHKMKSAFKQFKIYDVASLLEQLEQLRPDKLKAAQVFTAELERRVTPTLKAIQSELEKLG